MKSPLFVATCVAALLSVSTQSWAQDGTITGEVLDRETEAPVSGATVAIPELEKRATTASDGTYQIPNVPAGTYGVKATRSGYRTRGRTVGISMGETAEVQFRLQPTPESPSSVPGSPSKENPQQQATGSISGTVVDIDNQPVPNAKIRAFHVPSGAFAEKRKLEGFRADGSGRFTLTDISPPDQGYLFLTARSGKGEHVWFGTSLLGWESVLSIGSIEVVLKNEILIGPEPVRTSTPHLEIATVWRRIAPGTPYQQSLYVEVTNANAQDGTGGPWTMPYSYPLFEGFFSPFLSEQVRVSRAGTGVWELPGHRMQIAERWHPSREEIRLPLFASLRPRGATEVLGREKTLDPGAFQPFTKADLEERQDWDAYLNGVAGLATGRIPVIGSVLGDAMTILETYKKLTGPVGDRLGADAGLIDLSKSLGEAQETIGNEGGKIGDRIDLNKADQLESPWKGEAQSVVYEMPLSFGSREASSRPLWIYATWHGTEAQLFHGLEIGPNPEGPVSGKPTPTPAVMSAGATPSPAETGETVRFSVNSQHASKHRWTFGDGTSATGASVTHTFESPGTYTVKVTAQSATGNDSRSMRVTVEASEGSSPEAEGPKASSNSHWVYWSSNNGIVRARIDGSERESIRSNLSPLDTGMGGLSELNVSDAERRIFWSTSVGRSMEEGDCCVGPTLPHVQVLSARLDGTDLQTHVHLEFEASNTPEGLGVDSKLGRLLWSEPKGVRQTPLQQTFSDFDVENPPQIRGAEMNSDIAFDAAHRRIYWTMGNGKGSIMRSDLEGDSQKIILQEGSPNEIEVDGERRTLFWLEDGAIYRCGLNGESRRKVVKTKLPESSNGPTFTISEATDKIVYSDRRGILRTSYEGTEAQVIVRGARPTSLGSASIVQKQ